MSDKSDYRYIIGASGSGKTTALCKLFLESAAAEPNVSHILIVPEQFTLSMQKMLCDIHPGGCIMNIDILSFERLCFRVFRELGTKTGRVLEESGKSLIIRNIITHNKESLPLFGKKADSFGYTKEIKSIISELTQYRIGPEDIDSLKGDELKGLLAAKMSDISFVYKEYEKALKSDYITAEKMLGLLSEVIEESEYLREAVIAFDGFTGFVPLQEIIIKKLFLRAKSMFFTVTIDPIELFFEKISSSELFFMSKSMIRGLDEIAQQMGAKKKEPIIADGKGTRFFPGGKLEFLEKNIFRNGTGEYTLESKDNIEIYSTSDPKSEIEAVACFIKKEVVKGAEYRDFAFITSDMKRYIPYVKDVFSAYNIPLFIDSADSIISHPLISFITSLMDVFIYDFSYRSIMAYLRSGFLDIEKSDIDIFENYLLATGIRGKRAYYKEFIYKPRGIEAEALSGINKTRQTLVESLCEFDKDDISIRQFLCMLYEHMCKYHIEKISVEKDFKEEYDLVIGLFEKIDSFLSTEIIDISQLKEIFLATAADVKCRILPEKDVVVFGDIRRSRIEDVDTLFIIGANEGLFPAPDKSFGIISEAERVILEDKGIKLSPLSHRRAFDENFYIYLALTRPSRRLVLTYSRFDSAGKAQEESNIISMIRELFPELRVVEYREEACSLSAAKRLLAKKIGNYLHSPREIKEDDELINLLGYFKVKRVDEYKKILADIRPIENTDRLTESIAKEIYNSEIFSPISRLEKFAGCAYKYFLTYIIKLNEKQNSSLNNADIGNIYHDALYNFFVSTRSDGLLIQDMEEAVSEKYIDKALDMAYEKQTYFADFSAAIYIYFKMRLKRTLKKTIWAITQQIKDTPFRPEGFEISLGDISSPEDLRISLDKENTMILNGKIDRLDIAKTEDCTYIKIVDYKSSKKEIDLGELYNGTQLQLLYYLDTVTKGLKSRLGKEVYPAAAFYNQIQDPLIETKDIEDDVTKGLQKKFAPTGIESTESKNLLNPNDEKTSALILSLEDINMLLDFTGKKSRVLAGEMISGYIKRNPFSMGDKKEDKKACDFCPYKSLCSAFERNRIKRNTEKIKDIEEFKEILKNDELYGFSE